MPSWVYNGVYVPVCLPGWVYPRVCSLPGWVYPRVCSLPEGVS